MGTHPRFERKDLASLITNHTRNSELWFVNNPAFESAVLGELAVCCERYNAEIYAFAIEGNHFHYPIQFPEGHISSFLRDLNSWVVSQAW